MSARITHVGSDTEVSGIKLLLFAASMKQPAVGGAKRVVIMRSVTSTERLRSKRSHRGVIMSEEKSDNELTWWALVMRANWIETGDVNLSSVDVEERNQSLPKKERAPIRALAEEQMVLVVRLRALARKYEEKTLKPKEFQRLREGLRKT